MDIRKVRVGKRVWWNDPEGKVPGHLERSICSYWGKVIQIDTPEGEKPHPSDIITLEMENGGECECYAHELTEFPPKKP